MAQQRPLLLSLLIVLAYSLCGWIWFGSSSTGLVGSIVFLPLVLAYGAGYCGGDAAFWIALLCQMLIIWLIVYGLLRVMRRPGGRTSWT
jgi:hypothetical protein